MKKQTFQIILLAFIAWLLSLLFANAATPFDDSHSFELFTCDAFLASSVPACAESNDAKWDPNFLLWPVLILGWDFIYRAEENNRGSWNEFETLDCPGVLLGTLVVTPILKWSF